MTETPSPFDDDEVKAAMAEAGIVHRPGMADQMMQELAPLLAEDGFDMGNLSDDVDFDQLNAALASATERYNMELFTPVGAERDRAVLVLRRFSGAIHRGQNAQAQRILDAVKPEASGQYPSAAQLIGTSLDFLDSWFSASPPHGGLDRVKVPAWTGPIPQVAKDLRGAAVKGRAYQSLDSLIVRYGGRALADGAALLIAASLQAMAAKQQRDFDEVVEQHLPSDAAGVVLPVRPAQDRRSVPPLRPRWPPIKPWLNSVSGSTTTPNWPTFSPWWSEPSPTVSTRMRPRTSLI